MLTLFVFMGVVNGYVTGRMLRGFALTDWTGHTAKTALAFPSVVFGVVFALNLLIWGRRSAAAVPFGEYLFISKVSLYFEFLFIYVWAIRLTYSVFPFNRHPRRFAPPVGRHQHAAGVRRLLLWLQDDAAGDARAYEQDPAAGPASAVVHVALVQRPGRRSTSIRRGFHRAVLHPHVHVAAPDVLHLRHSLPCVRHTGADVRGDHDRALLLPAVRRGLQVVVAVFFHFWKFRVVR